MNKQSRTEISGAITNRTKSHYEIKAYSFNGEELVTRRFSVHQADCIDLQLGKLLVEDSVLIANNAMDCKVDVNCKADSNAVLENMGIASTTRCGCCDEVISGTGTRVDDLGDVTEWCDFCVENNLDSCELV